METIRNRSMQLPLLLPGINLQTSPTDGYPIQDMQMIRFEGTAGRPSAT
jgi:hypothetical protein